MLQLVPGKMGIAARVYNTVLSALLKVSYLFININHGVDNSKKLCCLGFTCCGKRKARQMPGFSLL